MLIPYLGETGALLVAGAFVVLLLLGVWAFCWWLDKPRRDLVAEIKKRPPITITVGGGTTTRIVDCTFAPITEGD